MEDACLVSLMMKKCPVLGASAPLVCVVVALMGVACADDPAKASPDMSRADMARSDMASQDMARADMARADMARADMASQDMASQDMARADMTSPDMARADMTTPTPDQGADQGADQDMAAPVIVASDTCEDAADVTRGVVLMGLTTVGATDDYNAVGRGCPVGQVTGPDVVFKVSPAQAARYRVVVTPLDATFNPMIYVKQTCGMPGCLDGTVLNGPGQPESLTFEVAAQQTAYIIIDGDFRSGRAQGAFNLELTRL